MNMNIRKKKEYAVPQMETLELAYEKRVLLDDSGCIGFGDKCENIEDTEDELG
jgi:hypothetical protein